MIRPTVTYACETWVLNRTGEDMLNRWERKLLRNIFKGMRTEEDWQTQTNKKSKILYIVETSHLAISLAVTRRAYLWEQYRILVMLLKEIIFELGQQDVECKLT